jgi:60S ribosome subunit biogenesis protein NIP7
LKTHVAKVTENVPRYAGVVVFSLNDIPLGFGVMSKTSD